MSNDNNRVLVRMGTRSLTENELQEVSGGANTLASSLATGPISNPDDILDQ
jgi:bacteriocin-like protein